MGALALFILAHGNETRLENALIHYQTQMLILSHGSEVAVVLVSKVDNDNKIEYAFRFLNENGKVVAGKKTLEFVRKKRTMYKGRPIGHDPMLAMIRHGSIELDWVPIEREWGCIYYDPQVLTTQVADPYYFDMLDLRRFQVNGREERDRPVIPNKRGGSND